MSENDGEIELAALSARRSQGEVANPKAITVARGKRPEAIWKKVIQPLQGCLLHNTMCRVNIQDTISRQAADLLLGPGSVT
ncbi:hypothetical protein PoB_001656600 [Plakobranchus ocellatus]|uniref:Uncharacterized protein n=1 Tax=Plakobranchus ocellatus TaxID=259542 RepID=A0AAV3Z2J2_9GAST|nr:hypothetical protein PoB_001656600 [Plakobranchus ocellatus]